MAKALTACTRLSHPCATTIAMLSESDAICTSYLHQQHFWHAIVDVNSVLMLGRRAGVPFRETHHMSGAAVKLAEDKGCQLSDLTTQDLQTINKLFDDDVQEVWDFDRYGTCCG